MREVKTVSYEVWTRFGEEEAHRTTPYEMTRIEAMELKRKLLAAPLAEGDPIPTVFVVKVTESRKVEPPDGLFPRMG